MGAGAIIGGIGLAKGIFDSISGGIEKKKARESMDELRASQAPITNPYANLSISTQGGNFQGQQNLRSEASQLGFLSQAGGRGASLAPQIGRNTALVNQQIAGDFDRQQKEVDQLRARGEVYKAQMLERRYEQEAAGFAGQYNAGNTQMQNGMNQVFNTAASGFAEGGAFQGLVGGGNQAQAVAPIQGNTMGVQPIQTTGFQPLIIQ